MIKLFWNTHKQINPRSEDKIIREKEERDYRWGEYHKKNSDIWIYEILKKVEFKIIENEKDIKDKDTLIIVDSSIEEKKEFYSRISKTCPKLFLFHLGDETNYYDTSSVYNNCFYVWRFFCLNKFFQNDKVKCIPIGYKSGINEKLKKNRKYKWAFTGTPHKSSRHDLLYQFLDVEPFYCHKTEQFDEKIISVDEMSEVLSSTEFIPCPNGFFHPETYRLYEALECGCIPIVEDTYRYYDQLFPNNPFIKINKWIDAKSIVKDWDTDQIKKKSAECKNWWEKEKNSLQEFIKNKIVS